MALKWFYILRYYLGAVTGLIRVFTNSDVHDVLQTWISFIVSSSDLWLFFISPSFLSHLFSRYDVSQGEWVRCNEHIQKMCHYPVFGLKEGSLYQFRVCAVNTAGVGRPSKATDPIRTADPLKHTRIAGKWWTSTALQKWLQHSFVSHISSTSPSFLLMFLPVATAQILYNASSSVGEHDRSIHPSIHPS